MRGDQSKSEFHRALDRDSDRAQIERLTGLLLVPRGAEQLLEAAREALREMKHARVFVTSRQRIKRPEGEELYDEVVNKLAFALRKFE